MAGRSQDLEREAGRQGLRSLVFAVFAVGATVLGMGNAAGQSISAAAYKQILVAQEALENLDAARALAVLEKLLNRSTRPYTRAIALELMSFGHAARGDYRRAAQALQDVLAEDALGSRARRAVQFNLARMFLAADDIDRGLETLRLWFGEAEKPSSDAYSLLAQAYVRLPNYAEALVPAQRAVELSKDPNEDHYRLLAAVHYELGNIKLMAETLRKMVALWPARARYWKQLAWAYEMLEDFSTALTVVELAHKKGHVENEAELRRLAHLYLYQGVPIRAARVLEAGLDNGRIAVTGDNLMLLGDTLARAEETPAALRTLERAAALKNDAALYSRLAQSYLAHEQWEQAATAARNAVQLGGGGNRGQPLVTLGIATYELGDLVASKEAFTKAASLQEAGGAARKWLAQISSRQEAERREQGN